MAGMTEFYKFALQGKGETYDISILNANLRKIDSVIYELNTKIPDTSGYITSDKLADSINMEVSGNIENHISMTDLLSLMIPATGRQFDFNIDSSHVTDGPISTGNMRVSVWNMEPLSETTDDETPVYTKFMVQVMGDISPYRIYRATFDTSTSKLGTWEKMITESDISLEIEDDASKVINSKAVHKLRERVDIIENKSPIIFSEMVDKVIMNNSVAGPILIPKIVGNMEVVGLPSFDNPAEITALSSPLNVRQYGRNFFPYIDSQEKNGVSISTISEGVKIVGTATELTDFTVDISNVMVKDNTYTLQSDNITGISYVNVILIDEVGEAITTALQISPDTLSAQYVLEREDVKYLRFQIVIDAGVTIDTIFKIACVSEEIKEGDLSSYGTITAYEFRTPLYSIPVTNPLTVADITKDGVNYISNYIRTGATESTLMCRVRLIRAGQQTWTLYDESLTSTNFVLFTTEVKNPAVEDNDNVFCYSPSFKAIPMAEMLDNDTLDSYDEDVVAISGSLLIIAVKKGRLAELTATALDDILMGPIEVYYQGATVAKYAIDNRVSFTASDGDTYILIDDSNLVQMNASYAGNQSGQNILTAMTQIMSAL